jgi:ribosomal-protein-alanine N-acetyltransferase
MMMVRDAVAGDLEQIVEIARHSDTAAQWSREEYEKLLHKDKDTARRQVLLVVEEQSVEEQSVEEQRRVQGFIAACAVLDEWEIENIAVSGAARRRGLASLLLREFMQRAQTQGAKHIFLEVRESNRAARAFYAKWAFVEAGRRPTYYRDPPEDALILKFSFSATLEF